MNRKSALSEAPSRNTVVLISGNTRGWLTVVMYGTRYDIESLKRYSNTHLKVDW